MTPLASAVNRGVGNAAFETKRKAYAESEFEVARYIAENYETWAPERIASRQAWLAKQATAIWRVDGMWRAWSSTPPCSWIALRPLAAGCWYHRATHPPAPR